MSEILHSSRIKLYAHGHAWVRQVLINHLLSQADLNEAGAVTAMESFQFTLFCLLVLICFGEKLDKKAIKDIETAQRSLLLYCNKLNKYLSESVAAPLKYMIGFRGEIYWVWIGDDRKQSVWIFKVDPVDLNVEEYLLPR